MGLLGRLIIDIAANTSQLKTDMNDARRELRSFKGDVEGVIGSVVKLGGNLLKGFGIVLTVRELANQTKETVKAFADAERQSLRLDAVLRATGNSAGVSAKELKGLASELAKSSMFDDKAILPAIAQLETFANISGETFKTAIRLSVDLAALWDGDVSSAAYALGKALQSPEEAASLLGKAHVRLTSEERKSIDNFIRLGDVAGAQGVILKALEERVGGTAAGEASGLAGAFHRLSLKIEDARKNLVGFFADLGKGPGLADLISAGLAKGAGLTPPERKPPLRELVSFGNQDAAAAALSKEVGDLTGLAGSRTGTSPWNEIRRISAADISRLRELGREYAEALRMPNLQLEVRVRLAKELKAIQDALESLHGGGRRTSAFNLGGLGDLSRMGASAADQAGMQSAVDAFSRTHGLSGAMVGVGGERGASPLRDERTAKAAALWRETWINAIRGTQQAFTDFFDSIGQEGFNLVNIFRSIAQTIRHTLSEIASQQIVNLIFGYGGLLGGVRGPGGQTVGSVAPGNGTQSSPGAGFSPSVTHVHVTYAPQVQAMDQTGVQAMLERHGHLFVGKMMEGFDRQPSLARYVVAQGTR